MAEKYYEGIEIGKKYNEYSEQELNVLPPVPEFKAGIDYPAYYKEAPIYWNGYRWVLIFD